MTTLALHPVPERNNLPLSLCYSLALHVLIIALLGLLSMQQALRSPARLELVVVGLTPVAQVNLGQSSPFSSTPLRNPLASEALSAPQIAARNAPQQVQPRTPDQPLLPPLLTLSSPEPFSVPLHERTASQFTSQQQTAGERRNGQQVATAPLRGTGANLPVHDAPQVSANLPTAPGPATFPPFIPSSTPMSTVVFTPNPTTSQGGESIGVVTSSRKITYKEWPPVPEEIEHAGQRPEFRFKVLINPAGDIVQAEVHRRSSFPRYEEKLRAALLNWKFERGVGYEWRIISLPIDLR